MLATLPVKVLVSGGPEPEPEPGDEDYVSMLPVAHRTLSLTPVVEEEE